MEKEAVIEFFDRLAPGWDAGMERDDEVIGIILDNAGIREGIDVLDVACGTGVLFPDYFGRGVGSLTAIDIAPKMAEIAANKFPEARVVCGDVESYPFEKQFDSVMVYNAFPHFPEPARLIERLAQLLKPGGRLSVAHGMSRAKLLAHHSGTAAKVSIELLKADELAELFRPWFDVDVLISDDRMYQVAGTRRGDA
ncbi:MAG: class I SAM-dependent methyltransferase [Firmicutes bacterium]|nr:class I SAM-dependent methyltransferase [Bacillota bacterium]